MLSLESEKWEDLEDAYGVATQVPILLSQMKNETSSTYWDYLWASLCHQGSIYTATFAAIPLIVEYTIEKIVKGNKDNNLYNFLSCVEISRLALEEKIPEELQVEYFEALEKAQKVIPTFLNDNNDYSSLSATLAFQAALKSQIQLAEFLLNMKENEIEEVVNNYYEKN